MASDYDDAIIEVANTYGLPIDLLRAQVMQESDGKADAFRYEPDFYERYIQHNPEAKGYRYGPLAACSYGLLQVMLETALEMGFADRPELLFVPRIGLSWGAKKMQALWRWAGSTSTDYAQALAAYNGGTAGNVTRPFRNQAYVDSVYKRAGKA